MVSFSPVMVPCPTMVESRTGSRFSWPPRRSCGRPVDPCHSTGRTLTEGSHSRDRGRRILKNKNKFGLVVNFKQNFQRKPLKTQATYYTIFTHLPVHSTPLIELFLTDLRNICWHVCVRAWLHLGETELKFPIRTVPVAYFSSVSSPGRRRALPSSPASSWQITANKLWLRF